MFSFENYKLLIGFWFGILNTSLKSLYLTENGKFSEENKKKICTLLFL